ncbi:MAG: hypothetical protein U0169_17640 [Polyangiaceae bacterium]
MKPLSSIPAGLDAAPVAHAWNDAKPYAVVDETDDVTEAFGTVSYEAQVGFTIACAEWVLARLGWDMEGGGVADTLEATWASLLRLELQGGRVDVDGWKGSVRGAMAFALEDAIDVAFQPDEDHDVASQASLAAALVKHVLPEAARPAFVAWQEGVLARLLEHHIREVRATHTLVARDLYDLGVDVTSPRPHAAAFYESLRGSKNPYLRFRDRWIPFDDLVEDLA